MDRNASAIDIFHSFLMGLRFDIVISSYILVLPYIVLTILELIKCNSNVLRAIIFYYIFILFSLSYLVCAIDIPYFSQFFSRFSITAFEWIDSPVFVSKMIIQEPRYWLYLIPLVISIIVFYKLLKNIINKYFNFKRSQNTYAEIIFSFFFIVIIFFGIRGRIEIKSPIRVGTAYFSNNAFLNQLGLNPNFTLIRSYLDSREEGNKRISLMDDHSAILNVQKYLNIKNLNNNFPLLREMHYNNANAVKPNVILIIMESMSAGKMKRHGNNNNLTPFLDSISNEGYYFENAYTSGIHTFNGIFSSLFSYPAIFRQHPMKGSEILKYHGIASVLREKQYSTVYFTTHDGQFDNVEGFLKANDFERVVSKQDYPSAEVKTTLGVPDDYMFRFSIPVLNGLSSKNKPFFAAFMTASDHGPYYIPGYFKPKSSEIKNQIVEYADYSLKKFISLSSKQKWFENTIFVFVADHGAAIDELYDMSLDYNHTPLIFYAPKIIKDKKVFSKIAGQIDIFPSIMGLLQLSYKNNTLGIDLFSEDRPYILFNADDKYGVIDDKWFLIVGKDKSVKLYKYRSKDVYNYASQQSEVVRKMKTYAESNLQAFQYVIRTKKQ
ncbi:MAG: sulfatase-like hydrolase/transferase [Bacteroidota bacterium]|nr:sulfatase-like hydrolase/transferase [Bacteroidota bacterium]